MPNDPSHLAALEGVTKELTGAVGTAKVEIYGPKGVGKTLFAFKMAQQITPAGKDIIYVDAVEGWVTILDFPDLKQRVRRIPYMGLSQLNILATAVKEGEGSFGNVGCIILDEASTIAKYDLRVVTKARGTGKKNDMDPDVSEWPDYNKNNNRVWQVIIDICKLEGINVILLSHNRKQKNKVTQVEKITPDFIPSLEPQIAELMHVVAYMTAEQDSREGNPVYVRSLQVHPTRSADAKCRISGLDVKVEPSVFMAALKEWLTGTRGNEATARAVIDDVVPMKRTADDRDFDFSKYEASED